MEVHRLALASTCRVCGRNINSLSGNDTGCSKLQFSDELQCVFGINTSVEDVYVYGQVLCGAHRQLLSKARRAQAEGKTFKTGVKLCEFNPHIENNCQICSNATGTRRRPSNSVHIGNLPETKKPRSDPLESLAHLGRTERMQFLGKLVEQLDTEEKSCLAFNLGASQEDDVYKFAMETSSIYKNLDSLLDMDIQSYLDKSNHVILSFMRGASRAIGDTQTKYNFRLAQIVEQICRLRLSTYIGPVSFMQTISMYKITGSRQGTETAAASIPGGSYPTIRSWLGGLPMELPSFPAGVLANVYDNEQIIAKKSGIRPSNKMRCSVITNKGFVELLGEKDHDGKMQSNDAMKPPMAYTLAEYEAELADVAKTGTPDRMRLCQENMEKFLEVSKNIRDGSSKYFRDLEQNHYDQLFYFIDQAIKYVSALQKLQEGTAHEYVDNIDDEVEILSLAKTTIVCSECGTSNPKRKLKCQGCGKREGISVARAQRNDEPTTSVPAQQYSFIFKVDPTSKEVSVSTTGSDDADTRFHHIPSGHKGAKTVTLTEPVFCNPNSIERVASVLRQIGLENGVSRYGGQERHWTFVCQDGLPYTMCMKLIKEAVICDHCQTKCPSVEALQAHNMLTHPGKTARYYREFDWVYLIPGWGHYEMNLVKSFFELNWIPFMERIAVEMGFTSEAARTYAKKCKDTHLSFQLLLAFHIGSLREMVLPYVRSQMCAGTEPTALGFLQYWKKIEDPNCKYLFEQVCRFSQGIINFHMGIRRCCAQLVHSGKHMTKELFYGRNHPLYQNIEIFDSIQYLSMDKAVRGVYDANISLSTSGSPSAGQGLDFCLEQKNRDIKSYLPKSEIPSETTWRRTVLNSDRLQMLDTKLKGLTGQSASSVTFTDKNIDLEQAIKAWQLILRNSKYIWPQQRTVHISVTGTPLNKNLKSFIQIATAKRIHKICSEILCMQNLEELQHKHPVFVTTQEEESATRVEKKTKEELLADLQKMLTEVTDATQKLYYEERLDKLKKGSRKDKYISLHNEVAECLANSAEVPPQNELEH